MLLKLFEQTEIELKLLYSLLQELNMNTFDLSTLILTKKYLSKYRKTLNANDHQLNDVIRNLERGEMQSDTTYYLNLYINDLEFCNQNIKNEIEYCARMLKR